MQLYYYESDGTLFQGDCLDVFHFVPSESINCGVTSPPYWGLRDYGIDGQFGLESTPEEYIKRLVKVFREFRRILRDDGTLWLNLGDSYAHTVRTHKTRSKKQNSNTGTEGLETPLRDFSGSKLKTKDLIGIPWRVALALQADGWYLRQDIIWHKPNPMPESVTDRCTKSHEYIFLLSKSARYYYDYEAIKEPTVTADKSIRDRDSTKLNNTPGRTRMRGLGINNYETRNKRSVWTVTTKPYKGAHFATFPSDLIEPCILAGCPSGGVVMDMFFGAGTTRLAALKTGRKWLGIELSEDSCRLAMGR